MSLQAYTLEVREWDNARGMDADVLDEDGLVRASLQVDYADYDLMAERENGSPTPERNKFMADSDRIDLQEVRDGRTFTFRVLGDDDEVLSELGVSDTGWDLIHTD